MHLYVCVISQISHFCYGFLSQSSLVTPTNFGLLWSFHHDSVSSHTLLSNKKSGVKVIYVLPNPAVFQFIRFCHSWLYWQRVRIHLLNWATWICWTSIHLFYCSLYNNDRLCNSSREPLWIFGYDACRSAVNEQTAMHWYHFTKCTATAVGFLASIITIDTNCYRLTRVANLRIICLCLTGPLDNVAGLTWWLH